jgi:hypothetical protein
VEGKVSKSKELESVTQDTGTFGGASTRGGRRFLAQAERDPEMMARWGAAALRPSEVEVKDGMRSAVAASFVATDVARHVVFHAAKATAETISELMPCAPQTRF